MVERMIREAAAGELPLETSRVNAMLLNKQSSWVQLTLGDQRFYQSTEHRELCSQLVPREGVRGEVVVSEADRDSFLSNYAKAAATDRKPKRVLEKTIAQTSFIQADTGACCEQMPARSCSWSSRTIRFAHRRRYM